MMDISIDVRDLVTLENFFDELEHKDQRKILMSSYRRAVKPLLSAAKGSVPKTSMMGLYRSMGTEEIPGDTAILVGSKMNTKTLRRSGGKKYVGKVWYGHLVEEGTKLRHWRKGKSTGVMPASHFFRDAISVTEDQVIGIVAEEWYDEIERFINRTIKRAR